MNSSLKQYQKQIDDFLQDFEKPYWAPLSNVARLIEEVGETARIINHMHGDKIKKKSEDPDDLTGEMGDVLFTLVCLANSLGVDLDAAMQSAINKAIKRDTGRFPRKAGK